MSQDKLLLAEDCYKQTVAFDYVVKRHVKLYSNGQFETYADAAVPDHRTFELDASARLQPSSPDDIQLKRRYLRPPGVGSMTALAAVRGKGAQLELWTLKLKRDEHWDFTFCFQDRQQALRWHDTLTQVISALRVSAGQSPGLSGQASESGQQQQQEARDSLSPLTHPHTYSSTGFSSIRSDAPSLPTEESVAGLPYGSGGQQQGVDDDEEEYKRLLNVPTGATTRPQQRWVPWRHSNGLAIYQQHSRAHAGPPEYMVSAVVRGSPSEVLRVLMDPHSATTILGPALEVEVLDSAPGRQTLRIQLQAEGPNSTFFRPREAVVRRMLKKEEDGVYVVLFHSLEQQQSVHRSGPSDFLPGVIEVAEGLDDRVCRTNPIRCRVSGGYTISKLTGFGANSSPETLLTCVLQVEDMGGWLNPSHPLFRLINWWSGGAYEAFLERMLLGVMLVRDIVEKSRFAVTPQVFASPGPSKGVSGSALDPAGKIAPRSSSVVLRLAADSLTRRPGSPTARPASHRLSPFEAGAHQSMHAQVAQLQQLGKTSRLASQRLGSGGPDGATTLKGALTSRGLSGAVPELGQLQEQPEQQWDASFRLPEKFYEEIHTPGHDAPFKVRGPNYLSDGVKVCPSQPPVFELLGMEVVNTGRPEPLTHISRFLPSVRQSPKPFLFVWNMMIPGPPNISCVFVFGSDSHPDSLGPPPDDPDDSDWQPFDFLMYRFLHGDDQERTGLFKMVPHVSEGSWLVKQGVGSTPVIVGRKLTTTYHITPKYVEVDVDVGSSAAAAYITGLVRGAAKSLVLDLGIVLEGQHAWELPEMLLGAVRVKRLDLAAASSVDETKEVPILEVQAADAVSSTT